MGANVREADRDQQWLLPPSVAEWLPEGHLAWFVLDVVAELDLSGFYASYRPDGRGGASYDPAMVLAVLLYAYCTGERSSRRIERRCTEDVAFRVLMANQFPDHATLARFRRRHEAAIADVFGQVLGLCVRAGLVDTSLVAIDGTKMWADASYFANRTHQQLAEEILAEAERVDSEEDERLGERRGDELADGWGGRNGRRARIREALRQLEEQGVRDLESRMAERAAREAETGRKLTGPSPKPSRRNRRPRVANATDPDSRVMATGHGAVQGYNAQAAATADQVVIAAEVSTSANDSPNFVPVAEAASEGLTAAGHGEPIMVLVADAGYWSADNARYETGGDVLIATIPVGRGVTGPDDPRAVGRLDVLRRLDRGKLTYAQAGEEMGVSFNRARQLLAIYRGKVPDPAQARSAMETKLAEPENTERFGRRKTAIEPVFGQIKANRGYRRFMRRGKAAVESEWKLICATHNLLKLWRTRPAPSPI